MQRHMRWAREAGRASRLDQTGKINFISLLLVAGLVVAGYAGWVYVPLYLQNLDVRHRCQESINSTWRHKSERRTKEDVLRRIQEIDTVEREIGGDLRTVPAIDPDEHGIQVRIDETIRPNIVSVDISYDREVTLPIIGGTRTFSFDAYCEREME